MQEVKHRQMLKMKLCRFSLINFDEITGFFQLHKRHFLNHLYSKKLLKIVSEQLLKLELQHIPSLRSHVETLAKICFLVFETLNHT